MSKDISSETISEISYSIIETVSERSDTSVSNLPPLYKVVEVDALDQLCSESDGNIEVNLEYAGFEIEIDENQEIHLSEKNE